MTVDEMPGFVKRTNGVSLPSDPGQFSLHIMVSCYLLVPKTVRSVLLGRRTLARVDHYLRFNLPAKRRLGSLVRKTEVCELMETMAADRLHYRLAMMGLLSP